MKVNILYEFKDGPYGGVNQFLKALKVQMESKGFYTDTLADADVVLFNSSNNTLPAVEAKRRYPDKIFIQRMDGPTRLYNNMKDTRDLIANTMNELVADATVFQTVYSREANFTMGLKHNLYEKTIMNAPDENIFNRQDRILLSGERKIRLIASSWSANWNKGFETYDFLDKNLDFTEYEMSFVGNTPVQFENIKVIPPLNSPELAKVLKNHDIYITASKKDPCSNALIEALFCGLPAIALKDGGHPEIVQSAGEVFEQKEQIPNLLDKIVNNYLQYQSEIKLLGMNDIAQQYLDFFEELYQMQLSNSLKTKRLSGIDNLKIHYLLFCIKVKDKINKKFIRKE